MGTFFGKPKKLSLAPNNNNNIKKTGEYDYLLKFLVIGDSMVGKSQLKANMTTSTFNDNYTPTIGIDFSIVSVDLDFAKVKVQLWDTSGDYTYKTITTAYYRGANIVIIMCDITNRQSFDSVDEYMNDIKRHAINNVTKYIVGNKTDLYDQRVVTIDEAVAIADTYGAGYFEFSCKTDNAKELIKEILLDSKKGWH